MRVFQWLKFRLRLTVQCKFEIYPSVYGHIDLQCYQVQTLWAQIEVKVLKAARFGFKVCCLASSTHGYCYRFLFDEGAATRTSDWVPKGLSKPGQIVWTLMSIEVKSILDQGHLLATDNFYTDVNLAYALSQRQTDFIGTVRINRRYLPKSVLQVPYQKHLKGNIFKRFWNRFMLINWFDKKPVCILSSVGDA
ncbi:hypothetical protein MP228_006412 [Amoeboaphelidium protococcarum]|nr:hypothetical protein MP228_006412 [Amoeboaphelidium protococcarum]